MPLATQAVRDESATARRPGQPAWPAVGAGASCAGADSAAGGGTGRDAGGCAFAMISCTVPVVIGW